MPHEDEEKMEAAAIERFGGLDELKILELPKPKPEAGEVLIRIRAAGVGNWDTLQRMGEFSSGHQEFPLILGAECAGDVELLGANVHSLGVGDAVYSYFFGKQGAYAQYVAIKAEEVARKPASLSYVEAAGVPVDAVTAHQAIVDELKVQPAEWCFIAGGAGGVGSMAVQVAIALGARVIASAKAADFEILESFGVERDNLIDYRQSDVVAAVRSITGGAGADAALDAASGESSKKTHKAVRDGGRIAELTGQELPQERGVKVIHIESQPSAKRLTTIAAMIDSGQLKVRIGRVFSLGEAHEAMDALERHLVSGKIVLRVD
jgi:NADPH:quinone reductase-like Zn-dependent oxidoreductase